MPTTLSDFDTLVDAHRVEIYHYLWRMLPDEQDAEDALQDTFLRALRAFPGLRPDSNPRAWLYKIATNAALTSLKRHNRQAASETELDLDQWAAPQPAFSQIMRLALRQAVADLPVKQRAALLLRFYQGLEYAEIGLALDCSAEAARANLYQALRKLRRILREEGM